ncbi:uncharacterized protein LOC142332501 [Lycorma delicatula]|uniref:uncharacterized protein LOC142332501 n=1 Tax=Lycorma delicatula TaxID=130591 RepID=UPI003F50DBAD
MKLLTSEAHFKVNTTRNNQGSFIVSLPRKSDKLQLGDSFINTKNHVTETDTSFEYQEDLLQLKEEPLYIVDGDIEKDPLAIEETKLVKSENFKIENEEVTIDEGTIEDNTKNFINCKRCINNSVHDGIIKEKSNECMCVYDDVTTEKDLVENISSKNKLPIQKGKKLICEYCNESFKCKCYLKSHINFQAKERKKIILTFVRSLLIKVLF